MFLRFLAVTSFVAAALVVADVVIEDGEHATGAAFVGLIGGMIIFLSTLSRKQ
jgi:hypothetical protein